MTTNERIQLFVELFGNYLPKKMTVVKITKQERDQLYKELFGKKKAS